MTFGVCFFFCPPTSALPGYFLRLWKTLIQGSPVSFPHDSLPLFPNFSVVVPVHLSSAAFKVLLTLRGHFKTLLFAYLWVQQTE